MRILITGSTSGIGEQLTIDYAKAGHNVVACGRNEAKLQRLTKLSSHVSPLCFDLTDYDNYPIVADDFQPLDLVILNAGDCEYINDAKQFDAKKFERVININLVAIGYSLELWLKHIKPGGRLVLISSSACLLPLPRAEAYGASKAALSYLARTLAITLEKHNIQVTLVHPGFVETPLTDKNTFAMPMIISRQQAAQKIITGIENRRAEINFPTLFIFIMKCMRLLPRPLWNQLAKRMG